MRQAKPVQLLTARRESRTSHKGAALLESALIVSVALVMIIGIFDIGQILFIHQTMLERIRKSVRIAAIRNHDTAITTNLVVYGTDTPEEGATGLFGLRPGNVSVSILEQDSTLRVMVVTVQDVEYRLFTPGIARTFRSAPIRLSMPVEIP